MKRKWKLLLGSLCIVLVVVFWVWGKQQGLEANLLEVQPRTIAQTLTEEGRIMAEQEIPLYTSIGGKIIALPVREGQTVQKGDLLLTFEGTELNLQLQQLQGQLRSLQAQQEKELAELAPEKLQQLYELGAISRKEYEDALRTANSDYYPGQIAALQAQIASVKHKLQECQVYAPADGTIAHFNLKEGMFLSPGAPLMTLYQNNDYLVEVYLLTEDVAHIQLGMEVKLIREQPENDLIFTGLVDSIAPVAEEKMSALGLTEQRLKVTLRPSLPEELVVRPGYVLDAEFTLSQQENVLAVPQTVLFPYEGGEALWVVRENMVQIQPVQTGMQNEQEVVITEGLKAGDFVLLDPQAEGLKEGVKIKGKQVRSVMTYGHHAYTKLG